MKRKETYYIIALPKVKKDRLKDEEIFWALCRLKKKMLIGEFDMFDFYPGCIFEDIITKKTIYPASGVYPLYELKKNTHLTYKSSITVPRNTSNGWGGLLAVRELTNAEAKEALEHLTPTAIEIYTKEITELENAKKQEYLGAIEEEEKQASQLRNAVKKVKSQTENIKRRKDELKEKMQNISKLKELSIIDKELIQNKISSLLDSSPKEDIDDYEREINSLEDYAANNHKLS